MKGYPRMAGVREIDGSVPAGETPSRETPVSIESISAITLATHDMGRSIRFYEALGFKRHYGDADASFTSLAVGSSFLNIVKASEDRAWSWWGRVIFHVSDVDALYARAERNGLK